MQQIFEADFSLAEKHKAMERMHTEETNAQY